MSRNDTACSKFRSAEGWEFDTFEDQLLLDEFDDTDFLSASNLYHTWTCSRTRLPRMAPVNAAEGTTARGVVATPKASPTERTVKWKVAFSIEQAVIDSGRGWESQELRDTLARMGSLAFESQETAA